MGAFEWVGTDLGDGVRALVVARRTDGNGV
jgi:hypothetical protein